MADCPFASCPTEIVQSILTYLDSTSPASVRALAYTSKDFLLLSSPFIFHTVKIQLEREDKRSIWTQTNQLSRKLKWVNAFSQVRCLTIESSRYNRKEHRLLSRALSKQNVDALRQYILDTPLVSHQATVQYPTTTQETDDMWLPIANLLRKFSSLNDLLYDGLHQFAPCMLQAINEDSSSCRLWMNRFKLHSLGAEQIDPHEVALLSSPRLYSIKFDDFMSHGGNASGDNSIGEENKQDEDILYRTVASLSPFLKEVHSCYRDDQPYYPTDESSELQNRIDGQVTRSSLRYLSISGCENKSINKETMTMWNDFTDFSTLRTLRITNPLRYQALEFLANDCSFETLQSLELSLSLFATRLAWRLGQYDTPEARFLCSLRPLTNLTINDWTNKYPLECFLPHHGGKLTKLAILTGKNTHLLPSDVKQISEYCPNLQELEITLPRTQGNATEVESYRNLGRLPQLQSLTIRLDVTTIKLCNSNCSGRETPTGSKCVFTAPDASFDEFDMRPCKRRAKSASRGPLCRKGDFREMLINHAIDQNLAKAIFENIQSEKEPGTKPLKSLNLLCVGALGLKKDYMGSVWHFPHQEVLSALKRSWRVNRLSTGGLEAEEICTSSPKAETGESGNDPLPYILEGPFRRLWPEQQVGSDWFRDWSSLPLGTI